jgi:amino acid permease
MVSCIEKTGIFTGPIGLWLWFSISGLSHLCSIIIFAIQFYFFINQNIHTHDELESGWYSTDLANLLPSYYLLIASLVIILINIIINSFLVKLEKKRNNLSKFETQNKELFYY